jgi:hypothetical protein
MNAIQQSEDVRRLVRGMLESAPSYQALPVDEQRGLARRLVDVLSYIADPHAGLPGAPRAQALEGDANAALKSRLSGDQGPIGKDFVAGAARQGTEAFKTLVSTVDFPKFVSGLVEGVYTSIVRSSIKQMEAYGKLLELVAKSVEEFAKENVPADKAREFVRSSFPDAIEIGDGGKLALKEGADGEAPAPDFKKVLELQESIALTEENEERIVLAAQIKMARQRQQTLAQMVAMGINRIIVTDGEIKASVLFDMKARDTAQRTTQASTYDSVAKREETDAGIGGWFSGGDDTVTTTVSTAYSAEQEKSESSLDVRAKLSGNVTIKFKSETFPLERLTSAQERGAIQQKSTR